MSENAQYSIVPITNFFDEKDRASYDMHIRRTLLSNMEHGSAISYMMKKQPVFDVLDMLMNPDSAVKTVSHAYSEYESVHSDSILREAVFADIESGVGAMEDLSNCLQYSGTFEIHQFDLNPGQKMTFIQDAEFRYLVARIITADKLKIPQLRSLLTKLSIATGNRAVKFLVESHLDCESVIKKTFNDPICQMIGPERNLDGNILPGSFYDNDFKSVYAEISKPYELDDTLNQKELDQITNCIVVHFNCFRKHPDLPAHVTNYGPIVKDAPLSALNKSLSSISSFRDLMDVAHEKAFLHCKEKFPRLRIVVENDNWFIRRSSNMSDKDVRLWDSYFQGFGFESTIDGWKRRIYSKSNILNNCCNRIVKKMNRRVEICYTCGKKAVSHQQIEETMGWRKVKNRRVTQPNCKECEKNPTHTQQEQQNNSTLEQYL